MRKILFIGIITTLFVTNSFSQDYNFRHCRELITLDKDFAVKTTVSFKHELDNPTLNLIKENLFVKERIYHVNLTVKKTTIEIFHMSSLSYEDLKHLLLSLNMEMILISRESVDFKNENTPINYLER